MDGKLDRTERVELTVAIMVTDEDGRMLVEDRVDPDWGGLFFPGGHVEPGESFVCAAIREVREETGLTIRDPQLCGIKQFPIDSGRYLILYFRASDYSGTLRDSPEGPVFFCAYEDLQNYRLADNFLDTIDICRRDDLNEMQWLVADGDWKLKIL